MPKGLIIYKLKQRFLKLNDSFKKQEMDWESIDPTIEYSEVLDDCEQQYPQFNWRTNEEEYDRQRSIALSAGRNLDDDINSIKIDLKLYFQKSKKGDKYAYIKGSIPKKFLEKVGERLYGNYWIEWPLYKPHKDVNVDDRELDEVF